MPRGAKVLGDITVSRRVPPFEVESCPTKAALQAMFEERPAISFPAWQAALFAEPWTPEKTDAYRREVLSFLRHCKVTHAPATVSVIKQYLAAQEQQGAELTRPALRWFYQASQRCPPDLPEVRLPGSCKPPLMAQRTGLPLPLRSTLSGSVPPPALSDLGSADWERDLIRASREAGLMWRSEETYRGWAARFARFLAPRSPYAAEGSDVAAFLSKLAVEFRASPSTQKQALNALVFLMQKGLKRELGKMDFRLATPQRRVPTVLSRPECQRLFAALDGTERLMAELAYGAGLRLMELLRLRVHHLDLDRQRLTVYGGKGDRVNGCANAVV